MVNDTDKGGCWSKMAIHNIYWKIRWKVEFTLLLLFSFILGFCFLCCSCFLSLKSCLLLFFCTFYFSLKHQKEVKTWTKFLSKLYLWKGIARQYPKLQAAGFWRHPRAGFWRHPRAGFWRHLRAGFWRHLRALLNVLSQTKVL